MADEQQRRGEEGRGSAEELSDACTRTLWSTLAGVEPMHVVIAPSQRVDHQVGRREPPAGVALRVKHVDEYLLWVLHPLCRRLGGP